MARVYPTQEWHLEQNKQRTKLTKKAPKKNPQKRKPTVWG
jgi:hypothetical protein